ncbi:MAG: spondin domain-containing protein [Woeseiaceae bacterium]|nr:spondin domain-containing protein [Woeseiaceae bacterium]
MKKTLYAGLLATSLAAAPAANATQFSVEIENLSNAIYYTPFLAVAHPAGTALFSVGEAASANLQAMAEGGDISGLVSDVNGLGATVVENPAGGLLAPAASTTFDMNTDGTSNDRLTIVAMLLPTNDAFAGLNAVEIPTEPGTYTFNVPAYDAGTEANDEILNGGGAPGVPGMPADPGGLAGTGGTGAAMADANTTVHIHRGALGDTDATGGVSDLDSRVHRWLNPVIRVTVTVQ